MKNLVNELKSGKAYDEWQEIGCQVQRGERGNRGIFAPYQVKATTEATTEIAAALEIAAVLAKIEKIRARIVEGQKNSNYESEKKSYRRHMVMELQGLYRSLLGATCLDANEYDFAAATTEIEVLLAEAEAKITPAETEQVSEQAATEQTTTLTEAKAVGIISMKRTGERVLYRGKRGGLYYITAGGKKVYVKADDNRIKK